MALSLKANKFAETALPWCFLGLLVVLGVLLHNDYGLAWDDPLQRTTGYMNWLYLSGVDPEQLSQYSDRYYGPVFELVLIGLERIFRLTEHTQQLYFMRHLVIFISFILGCGFLWRMIRSRYGSVMWAIAGTSILLLSPRIFAHAFYNSKDIPFMVFFTASMWALDRYLRKKTFIRVSIFGVLAGLATGIRFAGILAWPIFLLFAIIDVFLEDRKGRQVLNMMIGITFYFGLIYLCHPILWKAPLPESVHMLETMKNYPYVGDVLYQGKQVLASKAPWHYLPVWISITTPMGYLMLCFLGAVGLIAAGFKHPKEFYGNHRQELLALAWIVIPLVLAIVGGITVYDSWRHLFFIYPAMIILMVWGAYWIWQICRSKIAIKAMLAGCFIAYLGFIGYRMIYLHPMQNLYFNRLAGENLKEIKGRYELDYWGLSYRKAYEFIAAHDPRPQIRIYAVNYAGEINRHILPDKDKKRFAIVDDPQKADYFLSNYRLHPDDYPLPNEVFALTIEGAKVVVAHRLR